MPITLGDLKLYGVEELSKILNIQDRTVRKMMREGTLPGRKLARRWYVSEEALREYFQKPELRGEEKA